MSFAVLSIRNVILFCRDPLNGMKIDLKFRLCSLKCVITVSDVGQYICMCVCLSIYVLAYAFFLFSEKDTVIAFLFVNSAEFSLLPVESFWAK